MRAGLRCQAIFFLMAKHGTAEWVAEPFALLDEYKDMSIETSPRSLKRMSTL